MIRKCVYLIVSSCLCPCCDILNCLYNSPLLAFKGVFMFSPKSTGFLQDCVGININANANGWICLCL